MQIAVCKPCLGDVPVFTVELGLRNSELKLQTEACRVSLRGVPRPSERKTLVAARSEGRNAGRSLGSPCSRCY